MLVRCKSMDHVRAQGRDAGKLTREEENEKTGAPFKVFRLQHTYRIVYRYSVNTARIAEENIVLRTFPSPATAISDTASSSTLNPRFQLLCCEISQHTVVRVQFRPPEPGLHDTQSAGDAIPVSNHHPWISLSRCSMCSRFCECPYCPQG